MADLRYCVLCGNEQTRRKDGIGPKCRAIVDGRLSVPFRFFEEARARFRMCCGGLSSDKTHLHFHGKYFDYCYPDCPLDQPDKDRKKYTEWEQAHVTVEAGISFFKTYAQTYYIRDFGNDTDSEDFGERIPYPTTFGRPARDLTLFWKRVEAQLAEAAKAAWNADLLTCGECGNHYYSPNGPCCGEENPDDPE